MATTDQQHGDAAAAVIREAIDHRFPDDEGEARSTAAQVLLDITAEPSGRPEGPADFKEAYAEELRAKAGRA